MDVKHLAEFSGRGELIPEMAEQNNQGLTNWTREICIASVHLVTKMHCLENK